MICIILYLPMTSYLKYKKKIMLLSKMTPKQACVRCRGCPLCSDISDHMKNVRMKP